MPRIDVRGVIVPNDDKEFYEWFGYEATSPKDIRKALEAAGGETADIYINSPGGEIASGSEIYAALREYGNVKIHITGHGDKNDINKTCGRGRVAVQAGDQKY